MFLRFVAERGTDGGTEFAVFRDVEFHPVEPLASGKDLATERKHREIADHHEILDSAVHRRKNRSTANALQHHPNQSQRNVFARGVALGIAKQRGNGVHRQSGQWFCTDVADEHVDFRQVATLRQIRHKGDVVGTISYIYKDAEIGKANLIAANDVEQDMIKHILHVILRIVLSPLFFIPIILIVILAFLVRAAKQRKDRKRRLQQIKQRREAEESRKINRTDRIVRNTENRRTSAKGANSRYYDQNTDDND